MFALIKSKNYFFGRKILFTPSQRKTNQFRSFGNVASNLNLSPAVRHLIFQYNLNPSQIQPTGPKGLILKGDVLKFMATPKDQRTRETSKLQQQPQTFAAPSGAFSKTPHYYFNASIQLDEVIEIQKLFQERYKLNIGLDSFVARAVALALKELPEANVFHDSNTNTVNRYQTVNIGIITSLPGKPSAYPVIPNTPHQGLGFIANLLNDVKNGAQIENNVAATFTVFSTGEAKSSYGIIPPSQTGILSIGNPQIAVVPKNGQISTSSLAEISLSVDPRAIDEVTAARFLESISKFLSNPRALM